MEFSVPDLLGVCSLFGVFYRPFRRIILEKKGIRKGRDISENRALYHISQHTPAGKAGCRYHEQGKRIGGGEPVPEGAGRKKDDAIAMPSDQLLTITERLRELERRQPEENK